MPPWTATAYQPTNSFEAVFGRDAFSGSPTLLDVLGFGGGGLNALSRHAVAALLNASHPAIDPAQSVDTPAEVIALWQYAFDSGNASTIESTKNIFAASNEAGCVVDAHGRVITPPNMPDSDHDAEYDAYDNCSATVNVNQDDNDHDGRGDACDPDDDNDGCMDVTELSFDPVHGGGRNPLDYWDFFDVTNDRAIDVADALAVIAHFGQMPNAQPGNAVLDRYAPDPTKPWRTAQAVGAQVGIDVTDVTTLLRSFGHSCK